MATQNAVDTSLAGQTGTGSFAGSTSPSFTTPILGIPTSGTLTNCTGLPIAGTTGYGTGVATALAANVTGSGGISLTTSPTFVTPVLGAATATSINFGGSTLSNYVSESSWTPTFTFATAGNLSVSYVSQTGLYTRIGSMVFYQFSMQFTPTFTTSSGIMQVGGLPITIGGSVNMLNQIDLSSAGITYPTGTTSPFTVPITGGTVLDVAAQGSATGQAFLGTTSIVSGVQLIFIGSGFYFI